MRRMHTLVGIALLTVLAAPVAGASFDEWLPESTVAYVSVENVSGICARFEKGPLGALWNEEEVQAFLELPRKMLEEKLLEVSEDMGGARPDELLKMLQGQVAFAFTGFRTTEQGSKRPGVVLLADIGENGQKVREWFSRIEKSESFRERCRLVEDEFRGIRIVTYIEEKEEEEDDDSDETEVVEPGPACYFIDGSTLAFSDDPVLLRGILDRRDAEDAVSLAGCEDYRVVRRRTGAGADLVAYVSITEVMQLAFSQMDDEKEVEQAKVVISALGLDSARAVGLRASLGDKDVSYNMFILAPGEKTGLMKLFGAKNSALVPPSFVPAGVATGLTLALDFQELWREGLRVAERIKPGATEAVEEALAMAKEQSGIDIQEDLIGSLGGKITFYQFPADLDTDATPSPLSALNSRFVFAIELANVEKMTEALETLLGMAPVPLDTQEYMGATLYVMDSGFLKIGFATVAGHLVFATNIDDLRAIVQTQDKEIKGLADTEDFARAMSGLPESRSMVSFSDPRLSMGAVMKLLTQMGPLIVMGNPEMSEWFDFTLLPDAATLTKYMDVGGSVMVNEEDGVSLVAISRMRMPE